MVVAGGFGTDAASRDARRSPAKQQPFQPCRAYSRYPDGLHHLDLIANPASRLRSLFIMVKAIRGNDDSSVRIQLILIFPGTLVKCDASIKAMLVDIDSKNNNEYIIEELDEEHILVKETKINELKGRLNEVRVSRSRLCSVSNYS
jgi:TFIIH basal transcription factor complex TTD-A subunit